MSAQAIDQTTGRTRAVIIGASIAGALAGRVLADRYDDVVMMDRDSLPDSVAPRNTVPQEHHVHLLLQRGKQIIEDAYPGFLLELETLGAEVVDLSHGVKWFQAGRWKARWPTGIQAHYCTRTLVEYVLRRRAALLANLTILDNTDVEGLIVEDGAVAGVRYRRRGGEDAVLKADLVIDASGRGSKANDWLERLGLPKVGLEQVVSKLGYASRIYRRQAKYKDRWKVLLLSPSPPVSRRIAVISPIEDDRWMVTAGGWFGDYPDKSEASWLGFLKDMPVPDAYVAVAGAEPLSDVRRYTLSGGLRRRFDQLADWPTGLFVLGDSVCSVNPIYSQGMSVCAMQAQALETHIDGWRAGHVTALAVQSAIVRATDRSWTQAAAGDRQFPELAPTRSLRSHIHKSYLDLLTSTSADNRAVLITLLKISNLVEEDHALYRPSLAIGALRTALGQNRHPGLRSRTYA